MPYWLLYYKEKENNSYNDILVPEGSAYIFFFSNLEKSIFSILPNGRTWASIFSIPLDSLLFASSPQTILLSASPICWSLVSLLDASLPSFLHSSPTVLHLLTEQTQSNSYSSCSPPSVFFSTYISKNIFFLFLILTANFFLCIHTHIPKGLHSSRFSLLRVHGSYSNRAELHTTVFKSSSLL